ncbi:DUF6492 family protein [Bradyrhizobium sp.]|uniref:DUF6492 family protein n=1 Tax=Bradyrhizobium sp. TaxID=376 RepID=UPI001D8764EB|nr:DUF6492 family protein [Bradyrhizobium sp.]MBV8698838.1 hypothetical protein [Bradyrhizobium sp.]MBV9983984.1 hypothetical protein [Bradyrhizobium sp.]
MMKPIALLTPTYRRDLDRCALLCESVDRHLSAASTHYLLVPDADLALFAPFTSKRRVVLAASHFLPDWLRPLPSFIRRNRRQFWWSWRAKPVNGWHIQQILKIAAAIALPEQRYCILDSDIVFFRDFDLSRFAHPRPIPLLARTNEVSATTPCHARWIQTSHQLLGLPAAELPAEDFIGHVILWDQDTVRALAARIETTTGRGWIEALCRTREFSEYMLYGIFAQTTAGLSTRHIRVGGTPCASYWDAPTLGRDDLTDLLRRADKNAVAFSIASFSGTAVDAIRTALVGHERRLARSASASPPAELATPC